MPQKYDGGSSVTIYAPEDAETKKLNAELQERKAARKGKASEPEKLEKLEELGRPQKGLPRSGSKSHCQRRGPRSGPQTSSF